MNMQIRSRNSSSDKGSAILHKEDGNKRMDIKSLITLTLIAYSASNCNIQSNRAKLKEVANGPVSLEKEAEEFLKIARLDQMIEQEAAGGVDPEGGSNETDAVAWTDPSAKKEEARKDASQDIFAKANQYINELATMSQNSISSRVRRRASAIAIKGMAAVGSDDLVHRAANITNNTMNKCSDFSDCAEALADLAEASTHHPMLLTMSDFRTPSPLAQSLRASIENLPGIFARSILDFRLGALLINTQFVAASGLYRSELNGRTPTITAEIRGHLQLEIQKLILQYQNQIVPLKEQEVIDYIVDDVKASGPLDAEQLAIATEIARSILESMPVSLASILSLNMYIKRVNQVDIRPWIDEVIAASKDGKSANMPWITMLRFFKYEMKLPFRREYVAAMQKIFANLDEDTQKQNQKLLDTVVSSLALIDTTIEDYLAVVGLTNKTKKIEFESGRRLIEFEKDLALASASFHSLYYQSIRSMSEILHTVHLLGAGEKKKASMIAFTPSERDLHYMQTVPEATIQQDSRIVALACMAHYFKSRPSASDNTVTYQTMAGTSIPLWRACGGQTSGNGKNTNPTKKSPRELQVDGYQASAGKYLTDAQVFATYTPVMIDGAFEVFMLVSSIGSLEVAAIPQKITYDIAKRGLQSIIRKSISRKIRKTVAGKIIKTVVVEITANQLGILAANLTLHSFNTLLSAAIGGQPIFNPKLSFWEQHGKALLFTQLVFTALPGIHKVSAAGARLTDKTVVKIAESKLSFLSPEFRQRVLTSPMKTKVLDISSHHGANIATFTALPYFHRTVESLSGHSTDPIWRGLNDLKQNALSATLFELAIKAASDRFHQIEVSTPNH
jgi:hypothetical protein